jgi:hypothetical protein
MYEQGMKVYTQEWNYVPEYEISFVGAKLLREADLWNVITWPRTGLPDGAFAFQKYQNCNFWAALEWKILVYFMDIWHKYFVIS